MIDETALLTYLRTTGEAHGNLAVYAIYVGIADRIARGDFDQKEDD